jgi:FSR family fosmidomycin resistance protein-like MFS transporter
MWRRRSPPRRAAGPAYVVLAGISFSHFLNDTMQSLIASVYPILKDNYALDLCADRPDHAGVPVYRVAAAAGGRTFHRQEAQPFSLAIGMGFHLLWPAAAQRRHQ